MEAPQLERNIILSFRKKPRALLLNFKRFQIIDSEIDKLLNKIYENRGERSPRREIKITDELDFKEKVTPGTFFFLFFVFHYLFE